MTAAARVMERSYGPRGAPVYPRLYFACLLLDRPRLDCLTELAKRPRGASGSYGPMSGGLLAALVQMGLADRIPPDRMGGNRYIINAAGLAALEKFR